jgi:hypothetical protein
MDFYIFRVSLIHEQNLFVSLSDGETTSREQWIRRIFSSERKFVHFGSEFLFKPENSIVSDDLLFGWIARPKSLLERTPPEEGLHPTEHESWQAAFVIVDPTEHADGQKVAMETSQSVGKPEAILASLFKIYEQELHAPYGAQIFAVTDEASFWGFAKSHQNRIKAVTFNVAAPNMFNDRNDFQQELRALRDKENVARVKATLESNTVLNTDSSRLRDIVDYTERGAGELSATAEDGTVYHSGEHPKKVSIKIEHHSKNESEFLRQIVGLLKDIFQ